MIKHTFRSLLACFTVLLGACSGGGSNGSGNPVSADRAALSASPTVLEVTARSNGESPVAVSFVTLDKAVPGGFFYEIAHSGEGIANASVRPLSDTRGELFVSFIVAQDLPAGIYSGSVRFTACEDTACTRPLRGSPLTIPTRYTVPAAIKPTTAVSLEQTRFEVEALRSQARAPAAQPAIRLTGSPQTDLVYRLQGSKRGIESAEISLFPGEGNPKRVEIQFRSSNMLDAGSYEDSLQLQVCFDQGCARQVPGSPINISTRYNILAAPHPDAPLLPTSNSLTLAHDVVDAEYVAALNALAIVSSSPDNRFYLYEPASNRMRSVALSAVPKAIAVSPDGSNAVVGHNQSLSVVALPASSTAALSARSLMLSINAADLVLDDRAFAHVLPALNGGGNVNFSTVRTALGLETQGGNSSAHANGRVRLHPNGSVMYETTPSDGIDGALSKFSINSNSGQVSFVGSSFQRTSNPVCGNLWFSADGSRIFTGCGYVLTSSNDASDMQDVGRLVLARKPSAGFETHRILWLSNAANRSELALIERDAECRNSTQPLCRDYVSLFSADALALKSRYSLPNRFSGNDETQQEPLMVFHAAQSGRYVLSRAVKPTGGFEYYLLTMPPD